MVVGKESVIGKKAFTGEKKTRYCKVSKTEKKAKQSNRRTDHNLDSICILSCGTQGAEYGGRSGLVVVRAWTGGRGLRMRDE